jgi:N-acetylglucosamine-6-phosphate deacetylase
VDVTTGSTEFWLGPQGAVRTQVAWAEGRATRAAAAGQEAFEGLPDDAPYFVPALPVEVHCHGMGPIDFSNFAEIDLQALDKVAAAEGVLCIPTLYLRRERLDSFVEFMRGFAELRAAGELTFIPAIALEGPLVASFGGTPATSVWAPSKAEWDKLAGCGPLGLVYIMLSPDALQSSSYLAAQFTPDHPSLEWIVSRLVENGVRPALGHFAKEDPQLGADCVELVLGAAEAASCPHDGVRVVTDHLFNEMPLLIKHAFRTRKARAERESLLASYDLPSWNLADLHEQVGPVPAAIMRGAHAGRIAACLNFDGEHVDHAIAKRAIEIVGAENMMLMTDRSDTARLAGQDLHQEEGSNLWYQEAGVVAAGTLPIDTQIANVRGLGVSEHDIWRLVSFTAYRTFFPGIDLSAASVQLGSLVTADRRRIVLP